MSFDVREIAYQSPDYALEIALRNKVLRHPLGLVLTSAELARESEDLHLGAFAGEKLVGCLVLTPTGSHTLKMRQVAVDAEIQGSGVGRRLVIAAESLARNKNYRDIILNARDTAVPFYLKLGYESQGEPFIEVTIPHYRMRKRL